MELLKDLPSYNKENFSRFTQATSKGPVKQYVRLKTDGPEEKPQIIVTDNETLLHKELEMLALRTKRKSLKRSSVSTGHNAWSKHARMDSDLPSSSGRHVRHAPDDDQPDSDNDSLSSAESMT